MKTTTPLFFDIETIADPSRQFERQVFIDRKDGNEDRVNFLPEYNQICTIAVGRLTTEGKVEIKTIEGNEKEMIEKFYTYTEKYILCGFNILLFDLPFIIKRWLYHKIPVPPVLKFRWKKPWDLDEIFLDLARVYQGPTFNMSALEDVSLHLNIPTPKEIMHGSEVQHYFDTWQIDLIKEYCRHDVHATILIYQRFKELNFL